MKWGTEEQCVQDLHERNGSLLGEPVYAAPQHEYADISEFKSQFEVAIDETPVETVKMAPHSSTK
jgi:hypothetical protein